MSADAPLLSRPVTQTLLGLSGPISLAMVSTFLFQLVDTWFVGQLGATALAALAFAATTYFLAVAVFMGTAVGVSALVGEALGAGNTALARRYSAVGVGAAVVFGAALTGLGLLTLRPLFLLLGASEALIPHIAAYLDLLYLGLPLLFVGLIADAALRATGEVTLPALIMGLAGVVNLVLDYLLIFGHAGFPKMGIAGAALATVLSWIFIVIAMGARLWRHRLFALRGGPIGPQLRQLVRLSTPAVATQLLLPLTAAYLTWLLARSGPEVVAAFGVAQRIETLGLVGITAVTVAIVPFVAQNYGARAGARIHGAVVFAGKTALYWGGGLCLVLLAVARPLASQFSDDPRVIDATCRYFYVVAVSYAPYGLVLLTAAIFNGIQAPGASLRVLLTRTLLFTAPACAIGALFGPTGIFAGIAAGNLLGAAYAARRLRPTLAEVGATLPRAERCLDPATAT